MDSLSKVSSSPQRSKVRESTRVHSFVKNLELCPMIRNGAEQLPRARSKVARLIKTFKEASLRPYNTLSVGEACVLFFLSNILILE